ncbi:hypothetical protein PLESTF_000850500 [Pleodorina starrii]|nr:hypothetical protein PLESTF_000850500 [Pleodorina starrii]
MGFNDPPAFPERNSLFDAAKAAVEQAAAAGSTAQASQAALHLDDDSRDALKFRRLLDDNLPLHPCCVCGIRMRRCDLRVHTYLHNVALLQPLLYSTREVDQAVHRLNHTTLWTAPASASSDPGPSTSTAPAQPFAVQYHLLGDERAGCIRATGNGDAELDICRHCSSSLANDTVPPLSYKAVDNGPRPAHLAQLTMLEERVVAPARVLRHLAICRHAHNLGLEVKYLGCYADNSGGAAFPIPLSTGGPVNRPTITVNRCVDVAKASPVNAAAGFFVAMQKTFACYGSYDPPQSILSFNKLPDSSCTPCVADEGQRCGGMPANGVTRTALYWMDIRGVSMPAT